MSLNLRCRIAAGREATIRCLAHSVGSGKTEAAIRGIQANPAHRYLYVAPTIKLIEEIRERFERNAPAVRCLKTFKADDNRFLAKPVVEQVLSFIRGTEHAGNFVAIITTETFRNLVPKLGDAEAGLLTVFLDEGIEPIEEARVTGRHLELMTEMIVKEGMLLHPRPGFKERLEEVAFSEKAAIKAGNVMLTNGPCRKLAALVVSDLYDCVGELADGCVQAVGVLKPDLFLRFRELVIIRAGFHSNSLALLWRNAYGVEVEPYELTEELWDSQKKKGHLIRIWHLLHPEDNSSKGNLHRNWRTGEKNQRIDPQAHSFDRVIDFAAREVGRFFGGKPFVWNANNDYGNEEGCLPPDMRLPARSEGMDQYKGIHNVACLLVINPAPPMAKLLSAFTGLTLSEIYFATKFSHTYQTIGRCSLRDRHSEEPIKLVVLSKAEADKLAELFEGAEVVGQLGNLPQLSTLARGIKIEGGEKVEWSLHRKAYFKYRDRMKGHGSEPLPKEEWLCKLRLPNLGNAPAPF